MERPEIIINWWGIVVAAICYFILGAVWYSEKFMGKIWMEEGKIEPNPGGMPRKLLLTFGGALVIAFVMTHMIAFTEYFTGMRGLISGAQTAFWGWLGLAAAPYYIITLFEDRSYKYFMVNAGYQLVGLVLIGIILSMWR